MQSAVYVGLALGYALLLFLAVRHRAGRGKVQRSLEVVLPFAALWTLSLGLLAFLAPGGWWHFLWRRVAQFGLVGLALLTADFADAFVQRPSLRWLRLSAVIPLVLTAVVLDTLSARLPIYAALTPSVGVGPVELATLFLVMAWLFASSTAWQRWIAAQRRAAGSKHRNRLRYLGIVLLSFAVGDLLLLIGGTPDVYVGLVARLLGFSVATFAVLRYDLPDIKRLVLRVVHFALLAGFAVCLYLAALLVVGYSFGVFSNAPSLAAVGPALGFALVIASVANVVLGPRLRRLLDRTILGESYDAPRALRAYSQQINLILDLDRLAATTLNWLQTTLRVQRSAFLLLTPQGDGRLQLRVLRTVDAPSPSAKSFKADSRFITHFRNTGRPLSQYDIDMLTWFRAMPADERAWLRDLTMDLYVPIRVADKPVALLALGPKVKGQPYSEEELETLMILAGQTGTALENARLLDDLRAVQGDLHHLNAELAETNQQLKRLDQTKADFITIASHELRTPLSQIYGYSDVLSSLKIDELNDTQVVHQFVQGISRGARRLKQVVDAMVDMSLIETGELKLHPVTLPLSVVVSNAIETVRSDAEKRNQTLTVRDISTLPYIEADSARIEQVFVGLLRNAVKFTPDGKEIVISGRTASSPSEGDYVELTVADQGIGIDPDQQELIFQKFYRPENPLLHSTDDVGFKGAGPGLGLAIAQGIVEAHGGRIWVESLGRDEKTCPGSTFHVRLPVGNPLKG